MYRSWKEKDHFSNYILNNLTIIQSPFSTTRDLEYWRECKRTSIGFLCGFGQIGPNGNEKSSIGLGD